MHDLTLFKTFATILTFLAGLMGGAWPLFRRYHYQITPQHDEHYHGTLEFPSAEAIAAGIFLAAGLLDMLATSTHTFMDAGYHYPFSYLIASITFLILLGLEHAAEHLKEKGTYLISSVAVLTAIILIIHSFLEGLAVGVNSSFSVTFILFLAIIAHKSADSFALTAILSKSALSLGWIFLLFLILIGMTPFGILLGNYAFMTNHNNLWIPIFTALAAGTFLYMGTLHGFERASLIHRCCNLKEFILMLLGFATMAVVLIWT